MLEIYIRYAFGTRSSWCTLKNYCRISFANTIFKTVFRFLKEKKSNCPHTYLTVQNDMESTISTTVQYNIIICNTNDIFAKVGTHFFFLITLYGQNNTCLYVCNQRMLILCFQNKVFFKLRCYVK